MRRITPLAATRLRGVTFNDNVGVPPEVRWVDPATLIVDDVYQRRIGEAGVNLIRRVLGGFDWASFQAPVVVETSEGLKVTNGQHTATIAATHPRVGLIPVLVNRDRAAREEARSFVNVNSNRIDVTRTQLWHSALAAGDAELTAIATEVKCAGVRVLKNPPGRNDYRPGDTVAVGTIQKVYRRRGPVVLRGLLTLLATRTPVTSTEILALELLKYDPDYRDNYDPVFIAPIVAASSDYERHEVEAIAATHAMPQYAALAMVWYRRVPRRAFVPVLRRV